MTPLAIAVPPTLMLATRTAAVTTGAISGLAAGGLVVGMLAGTATVILLFLSIAGTNLKNKRDAINDERLRQLDLKAAEDRGWDRAIQIMSARGAVPPPRQRRHSDDHE